LVSEEDDGRSAFEAALGYEYFALQGLRSSGRGRSGLTIASSVAVVNTLVCGASVAFAVAD
jgi:hypothetical protein